MFDAILQSLKNRVPLAPLCPSEIWQPQISQQVLDATDYELFGSESNSSEQSAMRLACRSGLLLLNDDLNASHHISQQIETTTGSFWHAIMHCREGDFSNANYWYLKSGSHPAFEDVHGAASKLLSAGNEAAEREFSLLLATDGVWKPLEFVELCENSVRKKTDAFWLQSLQLAEMTILLEWCRKQVH